MSIIKIGQSEHVSKDRVKESVFRNSFNPQKIEGEFIQSILENHFHDKRCKVSSFQFNSLGGGFHSGITGGEFFKIDIQGKVGNTTAPSIVLKHSPSFQNEQSNLFKLLRSLGHTNLVEILKKYPSNQVNRREMLFYECLSDKVIIKVPDYYLGVINPATEESWLFLEDLTGWRKLEPGSREWVPERLKKVLQAMAKFHSVFWGKDLDSFDWIGRWWDGKNNDYASEEVAYYGLEACAKIYPDILTRDYFKILSRALEKRKYIYDMFSKQRQTLIHWDFNPNNILFNKTNSAQESFAVLDWQVTSVGVPQWDIAQLIFPNMGILQKDEIEDLVRHYISSLEEDINERVDFKEFIMIFDLVVLDHFFRVCAPILIEGKPVEQVKSGAFLEWANCLGWIRERSANWL